MPSARSMPSLDSACRRGVHELRQHLTLQRGHAASSPGRRRRPVVIGIDQARCRGARSRWSEMCWISPRTHRWRFRGKAASRAPSTSS